jgi:hypothetical protein
VLPGEPPILYSSTLHLVMSIVHDPLPPDFLPALPPRNEPHNSWKSNHHAACCCCAAFYSQQPGVSVCPHGKIPFKRHQAPNAARETKECNRHNHLSFASSHTTSSAASAWTGATNPLVWLDFWHRWTPVLIACVCKKLIGMMHLSPLEGIIIDVPLEFDFILTRSTPARVWAPRTATTTFNW